MHRDIPRILDSQNQQKEIECSSILRCHEPLPKIIKIQDKQDILLEGEEETIHESLLQSE